MAEAEEAGEGKARGVVIFGKTVVLAAGVSAAAWAIWRVADWLRGMILAQPLTDGGEWAALLGGGLAAWAFFLFRSGLIQQTLDILPRAKDTLASLRTPGWKPFLGDFACFVRAVAIPGIVTVFALVFAGNGIVNQIVPPVDGEPDLATRVDKLGAEIGRRLTTLENDVRGMNLRAALTEQGYTERRAGLLEVLEDLSGGNSGYPSDYYFARFPVGFATAEANNAGQLVVGVDTSSVRNPELVREIVRAFLPCSSAGGDDPVILKVEGYASSEPFGSRADSDELNVKTANGRRHTVARMLRDEIGSGNAGRVVVCESDDYESLAAMERDREFNDLAGGSSEDQYLLTRAAHVKVLYPGRCAVGEQADGGLRHRLTPAARKCLEDETARLNREGAPGVEAP